MIEDEEILCEFLHSKKMLLREHLHCSGCAIATSLGTKRIKFILSLRFVDNMILFNFHGHSLKYSILLIIKRSYIFWNIKCLKKIIFNLLTFIHWPPCCLNCWGRVPSPAYFCCVTSPSSCWPTLSSSILSNLSSTMFDIPRSTAPLKKLSAAQIVMKFLHYLVYRSCHQNVT